MPHDKNHAKATMERISGTNCSGALVRQQSVEDVILESLGTEPVSYDGTDFLAKAVWVRRREGIPMAYFVRHGQKLMADGGFGFESSSPLSLYVDGRAGRVVSEIDCMVEFSRSGLKDVFIDGVRAEPLRSSAGKLKIHIPAGWHELLFLNMETSVN